MRKLTSQEHCEPLKAQYLLLNSTAPRAEKENTDEPQSTLQGQVAILHNNECSLVPLLSDPMIIVTANSDFSCALLCTFYIPIIPAH